ncbi:MAG TPA: methyl-accepting chemotaxis protein, partial [Myxococcaceae bacterium]|nr:methyl-accepting chemotaxis protein [Myxococcaceae bacterium]
MPERPSPRFGLLARLALTVFGGVVVILLSLVVVAFALRPANITALGDLLAGEQLPYARACVQAASGGDVPGPDAVAAARRKLATSELGLRLRVFDHGRPVGDDLPVDAMDHGGLAAVRADPSAAHGVKDPTYFGEGGFRYYAPLGSDPEVVISVGFPIEAREGDITRVAKRATAALVAVILLVCAAQYLSLRRTTRRITVLARAVSGMADSSDFSRALPPHSGEDEIGQLGAGVHALATLLSATATALKEGSTQLAEAGQALARTVDEQSQLLRRHSATIEEAAASAEEVRQTSETAS